MVSNNTQQGFNQFKQLGNTSISLPRLGFGAAPVGNLYQAISDKAAQDTILEAFERGIRYFDTAPHYGFGLSESRLGAALVGKRKQVVLSTKVGRLLVPTRSTDLIRHGFANTPALEPIFDYSYDAVMRSFEASLERLQTDHIDILLAHDLGPLTHGNDHSVHFNIFMEGGYKAMQALRAQGAIQAIGLGTNEWQVCEQALQQGDFDCFLLAGRYTLLEQTACETFLPLCAQRKTSVILGGPFNSGILATGVSGSGPFYYNYEAAPHTIIQQVQRLEAICLAFHVPLAAAALQFPGAHPQICSVIAGLGNTQQVVEAQRWMQQKIPPAFWQALREQGLINAQVLTPSM